MMGEAIAAYEKQAGGVDRATGPGGERSRFCYVFAIDLGQVRSALCASFSYSTPCLLTLQASWGSYCVFLCVRAVPALWNSDLR